jgi:exopolyphosphatase/guanosine-5'-triphosphate,3'-diphosphate pyrophosphatase
LIDYEGFHDLYREIVFQNRENRLNINGMIEMRVDMIVVALCLIKFLVERYDLDEIRTSAFALKEGYLLSKL